MYHNHIAEPALQTLQQAVQILRQINERQITSVSNERNYKLLEREKEGATWQERDERTQRIREAMISSESKLAELHRISDFINTFETLVSASVSYYNDETICPICNKAFEVKDAETVETF